jgi:hypothetical protein
LKAQGHIQSPGDACPDRTTALGRRRPFHKVRRLRFQPGIPLITEKLDRPRQGYLTLKLVCLEVEAQIEQDRLL